MKTASETSMGDNTLSNPDNENDMLSLGTLEKGYYLCIKISLKDGFVTLVLQDEARTVPTLQEWWRVGWTTPSWTHPT